ncbi:TPA: amino acid permease [Methanosarcina acetivorans]|uniref:Amino acid transporter n=2 Tax=Methanosarcina acetivorans TaxID=2214 RepID=Q8TNJ9_METAC|nr:APC family permease [Methanosarcina acetivorans]AAM05679.1 amino acid transporter [Methanosarcina acetivorans C2A]HIH95335.1 amino acid permease [Methanosarcina acetivorans]
MAETKSMGLWASASIGVGAMVGAGIFSIFGTAAQISGNAVYVSFIIAGMIALLNTYSYAKMGVRYPSAGGPVEFMLKGFGDGILSGGLNLLLWVGYVFGLALYAKGFSYYAITFLPAGSAPVWTSFFATAIILAFTAINFRGAKTVGKSELFIVSIKVGILLLFAAAGMFYVTPGNLSISAWPAPKNLFFGAGMVFLAYQGFGLITNAAEDMKNPEKNLPRALYLSVVLVIIIYVSVSLAVIGNLSVPEIQNAQDYALAAAAKPFLGDIGFKIMAFAALFSTSSAINASLYGGANVSYILAKDGELPEIFERKVWHRSPEGLFITSSLVILCANFLQLEGIGMLASTCLLMVYVAVNISHLRLLKETGAKSYIIWASLLSSLTFFCVLLYYEFMHSKTTLGLLGFTVFCCFAAEWTYRKYSGRLIKERTG